MVKKHKSKDWANLQKSRIFYENFLYQKRTPFEENKTVMKRNIYLSRQRMLLSYRETKQQINRKKDWQILNQISFFKNNFFEKTNISFQLEEKTVYLATL